MKIALLVFMLFAHIVDDYYLQGWLASAKQKKWWDAHCNKKLTKAPQSWCYVEVGE